MALDSGGISEPKCGNHNKVKKNWFNLIKNYDHHSEYDCDSDYNHDSDYAYDSDCDYDYAYDFDLDCNHENHGHHTTFGCLQPNEA